MVNSLTCQLWKVFEELVRDALVEHLELNELLKDTQHRFKNRCSCLTNLLKFWWVSWNMGDMLYLDFSKALEKMPHLRLLKI